MTDPDLLRQGAALVRRLCDGDDSVRGVLADWFEEYGIPGELGNDPYWLAILRSDRPGRVYSGIVSGYCSAWLYDHEGIPMTFLGSWPLWAWEGTCTTATH